MEPDPIVAEIHEIRQRIAARFDNDPRAIFEDARKRQAEGGREIVTLPPRRPDGWKEPEAETSKTS